MEIYPNIHMIRGLASRQYLLVEQESVILIDAGLALDHARIDRYITSLGIPPEKLKEIWITHADGDHYGGVNSLKSTYLRAIVRSSLVEAEAMKNGTSSRKIKAEGFLGIFFNLAGKVIRTAPAEVIGNLKPGMELPVMGGLQVLDSAGHTPDHLSFYLKNHGVLFAGDSILVHGRKLLPSTGANTWDLERARASFDQQLALDPAIIAGGHGWIRRR